MDNKTLNKAKSFVKKIDQGNSYHNFDHICSVLNRVQKNPLFNTLSIENQQLLELAAMFHDAGYDVESSEEQNLAVAVEALRAFAFTTKELNNLQTEVISELIYSTDNRWLDRIVEDGLFLSRAILKDADVTQTLDLSKSKNEAISWMDKLSKEIGCQVTPRTTLDWLNSLTTFTPEGSRIVDKFRKTFQEVSSIAEQHY